MTKQPPSHLRRRLELRSDLSPETLRAIRKYIDAFFRDKATLQHTGGRTFIQVEDERDVELFETTWPMTVSDTAMDEEQSAQAEDSNRDERA